MLRQTGWTIGDVMALRMWECGLVATLSALGGLAACLGYVFALGAPQLLAVLSGYGNLRASIAIPVRLDAVALVVPAAVSIAVYLAASLYPTWKTSVTDPGEAAQ